MRNLTLKNYFDKYNKLADKRKVMSKELLTIF